MCTHLSSRMVGSANYNNSDHNVRRALTRGDVYVFRFLGCYASYLLSIIIGRDVAPCTFKHTMISYSTVRVVLFLSATRVGLDFAGRGRRRGH